jgi:hypothetical protein
MENNTCLKHPTMDEDFFKNGGSPKTMNVSICKINGFS